MRKILPIVLRGTIPLLALLPSYGFLLDHTVSATAPDHIIAHPTAFHLTTYPTAPHTTALHTTALHTTAPHTTAPHTTALHTTATPLDRALHIFDRTVHTTLGHVQHDISSAMPKEGEEPHSHLHFHPPHTPHSHSHFPHFPHPHHIEEKEKHPKKDKYEEENPISHEAGGHSI